MSDEFSRKYQLHQSAIRAMEAILASYPMENPGHDDWLDVDDHDTPPSHMDKMIMDLEGHVWTDAAPVIIAEYYRHMFKDLAPDILRHHATVSLSQGWTIRALCLLMASLAASNSSYE